MSLGRTTLTVHESFQFASPVVGTVLYKSAEVNPRDSRLGRPGPGTTSGQSSSVGTALTKASAASAVAKYLNEEIMFEVRSEWPVARFNTYTTHLYLDTRMKIT